MKIDIACVGKIKEPFFREAVREYEKRLSRFCQLKIYASADEKTPEGASPAEEEKIKEKEGKRLLKTIAPDAYVICLAIEGETLSSTGLADKLTHLMLKGKSHITFVIGGSLGLSAEVLKRADCLLSFSRMTFPHQLMRVILLEQIYRSMKINAGEPYHK